MGAHLLIYPGEGGLQHGMGPGCLAPQPPLHSSLLIQLKEYISLLEAQLENHLQTASSERQNYTKEVEGVSVADVTLNIASSKLDSPPFHFFGGDLRSALGNLQVCK